MKFYIVRYTSNGKNRAYGTGISQWFARCYKTKNGAQEVVDSHARYHGKGYSVVVECEIVEKGIVE